MSKVIVDEIQTDTTNGNVRVIPNGTGLLEIKGAGGDDAMLQLNCSAQSHGVKLKSPAHSAGQSYTMILPDNQIAADKYLKVKSITGSGATAVGQLEYADVSTGITVQEEGSALSTAATTLNFVGSSVTASGTGATKTITISGGGGGLSSDAQNNTVGGTNAGDSFTGTDATDNTLIGYDAGTGITTADQNTLIGSGAGSVNNGSSNVYIGYRAGQGTTYNAGSCTKNVIIGHDAGRTYTGQESVLIGAEAGEDMTTGQRNTMVGYYCGKSTTTGEANTLMGYECGTAIETGYNNTLIGYQAGDNINSGVGNVCIGKGAGGYASPSGDITTGSYNLVLGNNSIQNLYCADTSISSSDSRDKTDVTSFNIGLAWIEALRPVTYRWDRRTWYGTDEQPYGTPDGSKKRSQLHIGFLAQEALAVEQSNGYGADNDNSLAVHLNEDGMSYGMKYERLVPILVNAIKELSTRVKTLEGG